MSIVVKSDLPYTGSKNLPNIIDFIVTATDKAQYLQKLISSVGGDMAYITQSNAPDLFSKLIAHRARVIADGGIVLSLANTLKAIIFATKNNLTSSSYHAVSPDFGVKTTGAKVIKLYSLGAVDLFPKTGDITKENNGNLNLLRMPASSSMLAANLSTFTTSTGLVLGTSSYTVGTGLGSTLYSPSLYSNIETTGTSPGNIQSTGGSTVRLGYRKADGNGNSFLMSAVSYHKDYSGTTFVLNSGGNISGYINDVEVKTVLSDAESLVGVPLYIGLSNSGDVSYLSEQWVIASNSGSLAKNLSAHLDKKILT